VQVHCCARQQAGVIVSLYPPYAPYPVVVKTPLGYWCCKWDELCALP
jgi:hypothetical protein